MKWFSIVLLCFASAFLMGMDDLSRSQLLRLNRLKSAMAGRDDAETKHEEDPGDDCMVVLHQLRNTWMRNGWCWTERVEDDGTIIFRSGESVIRIEQKTVHDSFFNGWEAPGVDLQCEGES